MKNEAAPLGKVRILIVDDHTLFREGITRVLNAQPHFEVVAHCASVQDALHIISGTTVDIVLLDFVLGQVAQFDFFYQAKRIGFTGRVLIVTARLSETDGAELIRLGASGVFLKHNSIVTLSESIRQVMNGQTWLEHQYLKMILEQSAARGNITQSTGLQFTKRERDVLKFICEGSTNRQIAACLNTSVGSIKSTVQRLFTKAGVRRRSQLVRIALELDQ